MGIVLNYQRRHLSRVGIFQNKLGKDSPRKERHLEDKGKRPGYLSISWCEAHRPLAEVPVGAEARDPLPS